MKRRVGRPKGSVNKNKEVQNSEPIGSVAKLALNQVDHLRSIKDLEIVVNKLSESIAGLNQRLCALEKLSTVSPAPSEVTISDDALA